MKLLEEKILTDGKVLPGNILKVDGFINHRIDVAFMQEIGREFKRLYEDKKINKILTIEASGIGIACITALSFDCPVVFAKKSKSTNISDNVYTAKVESFTHNKVYDIMVSKEYLGPGDRVLIIDDFLARGQALEALVGIVEESGAEIIGAGIVIEKAYQGGGNALRDRGIRIESLARIESMDDNGNIKFC